MTKESDEDNDRSQKQRQKPELCEGALVGGIGGEDHDDVEQHDAWDCLYPRHNKAQPSAPSTPLHHPSGRDQVQRPDAGEKRDVAQRERARTSRHAEHD